MEKKKQINSLGQLGKVVSISIREKRLEPVKLVNSILAVENKGLMGDRCKGGKRQVTLIQKDHLNRVGAILRVSDLDFSLTRRNILTEGIDLLSLKGKKFELGDAILEYSGECHPCSRMEDALGAGGYQAMIGRGGITAKIIKGGKIEVGSRLVAI